jgi:hypothetical protein
MSKLTSAALAIAAAASAASLTDAVYGAITGHDGPWEPPDGNRWAITAINALLAALYLVLAAALVYRADRIDGRSGAVKWIRRLLVLVLAVLAGVFLVGTALADFPAPVSAIAGIAFILMFLVSVALGIGLLRRPGLRAPAVLLVSAVPIIGLTAVVGLFTTRLIHPAYAETAVYVGLALLARAAEAESRNRAASGVEPLRSPVG